jgi:hypothetical protein
MPTPIHNPLETLAEFSGLIFTTKTRRHQESAKAFSSPWCLGDLVVQKADECRSCLPDQETSLNES